MKPGDKITDEQAKKLGIDPKEFDDGIDLKETLDKFSKNKTLVLAAIIGVVLALIISLAWLNMQTIEKYNDLVEKYNNDCPMLGYSKNNELNPGLIVTNVSFEQDLVYK